MDVVNNAKMMTAGIAVVLSWLFGEWSILLGALIFFVSFDFLTGILASGYEGKLKADVAFWGIPKKIMIFGLVAAAQIIDQVYLFQIGNPIVVGQMELSVMAATIFYYLVTEFISVSENLGRLNVPVPPPLRKSINFFKQK
ncbi:phage holin family protein [Alkalibacillus salilacus]|uniref:Toxin secretion/phage lysis holin n=1 Tax=Alkalibacillus salilacus TaxID=284582 RepID=A0ABT9VD99_9BACI|nr:phage holin family protein [Alkalibacillus salilacus]MDQ0158950.1 toxin secretion/phage lysis holin [Alkalibacillus salilacus]